MKKYKSLNNKTVEQVKNEIAQQLDCKVSDIRLLGSRITGSPRENSDLDVAICIAMDKNEVPEEMPMKYINVFGLNTEIHFVSGFDSSIYKYYSV